MALRKQNIWMPVSNMGMDTGKDPKTSDKILLVKNANYKTGGIINKDETYTQTTSYGNNYLVGENDVYYGVLNTGGVYKFDDTSTLLNKRYYYYNTTYEDIPLLASGVNGVSYSSKGIGADIDEDSDYYYVVYPTIGNIVSSSDLRTYYLLIVYDKSTGVASSATTVAATASGYNGFRMHGGYVSMQTANNTIKIYSYSSGSFSSVASETTTATMEANTYGPKFDMVTDGTNVYNVFYDTNDDVILGTYDIGGDSYSESSVSSTMSSNGIVAVCLNSDSTKLEIVYSEDSSDKQTNDGNLYHKDYTIATTTFGSENTVEANCSYVSRLALNYNDIYVNFMYEDANNNYCPIYATYDVSTRTLDDERLGPVFYTTPIYPQFSGSQNGGTVMIGPHIKRPTVFCAGIDNNVVAKAAPYLFSNYEYIEAGTSIRTQNMIGGNSDGYVKFACIFSKRDIRDEVGLDTTVLKIATIQQSSAQPDSKTIGDITYTEGSIPFIVDGSSAQPFGLCSYPNSDLIHAEGSGSGGGIVATAGTVYFKLIYEYQDANGNIIQSAPSDSFSADLTTAHDQIDIYLRDWLFEDGVISRAKIVVYRTKVGETGVYYRAGDSYFGSSGTVGSNPDVTENKIILTSSDTDIADGEILYTVGGTYENIQPYSMAVFTSFQDRIIWRDDINKSRLYYSKQWNNFSGIQPTDLMTIGVDLFGGDIKALSQINDKLIIFKENAIYATDGTGYNDDGTGYNYRDPYLISSNIGCDNKKSVLATKYGIFFEYNDKLYLLQSSLAPIEIGEPVQYYLDNYDIISSCYAKTKNCVYFFMNHTTPTILQYFLDDRKWVVRELSDTATISSAVGYSDDCVMLCDSQDYLYTRASTFSADDPFHLETGWLNFAQPGGKMKVYRILMIGEKLSELTFNVKIAYNYDPTWTDSYTLSATSIDGFRYTDYLSDLGSGYADDACILEITPSRGECSSIRLQIYDSSAGAADGGAQYEGYSISGFVFNLAQKGGVKHSGNPLT